MKESEVAAIIVLAVVCFAAVACLFIFTQNTAAHYQPNNNNNNYNPYIPPISTPIPTPTPTPQPKPNVERVGLEGEWDTVKTGLLSSKNVCIIKATYYNKGNAAAVMELTFSMTQNNNGQDYTVQDTQIVQLKAGELKTFQCTLEPKLTSSGTYTCQYKYL
jgi:hypothetical protein